LNVIDLAVGSIACFGLWATLVAATAAILAVAASSFAALAQVQRWSASLARLSGCGRLLVAIIGLAFVASAIFPLLNPTAGRCLPSGFRASC
jgi:hypothetical protein